MVDGTQGSGGPCRGDSTCRVIRVFPDSPLCRLPGLCPVCVPAPHGVFLPVPGTVQYR